MPDKLDLKIPVIAEAITWMSVLGNVQLGLRHPDNRGPSASVSRQFAQQLAAKLHAEGVLSGEEMALILRDEMVAQNKKPSGTHPMEAKNA